jgi:hypothetical protein
LQVEQPLVDLAPGAGGLRQLEALGLVGPGAQRGQVVQVSREVNRQRDGDALRGAVEQPAGQGAEGGDQPRLQQFPPEVGQSFSENR